MGEGAAAVCGGEAADAGGAGDCAPGLAPCCVPTFAGGAEALDARGEAAGAARGPGLGCAGAASSSAGAALPMLAKSGPIRVLPSNAGRSKMYSRGALRRSPHFGVGL